MFNLASAALIKINLKVKIIKPYITFNKLNVYIKTYHSSRDNVFEYQI